FPGQFFFCWRYGQGKRRGRPAASWKMGKALVQLGREQEIAIHLPGLPGPVFSHIRPDVTVKRCIDLAAIEKLRQVLERMNLALFEVRRINDSFPVLVGKARGPNKNVHLRQGPSQREVMVSSQYGN